MSGLRRRVTALKKQKRFGWVERFELARVSDGYDDAGIDVRVVVRSSAAGVLEDAERLDDLADRVHRVFDGSDFYPYVGFVHADELAA